MSDEKLIIQIDYFSEPNPHKATAYQRFCARTANLEQEIEEKGWRTVVMDTSTYFELAARMYNKYTFHPTNIKGDVVQDERIHYGASTRACDEWILMRMPNLLQCNSLVLAHVDDSKDETGEGETVIRKQAALPGRLPGRVAGGFGEVWRVYSAFDDDGGRSWWIQTQDRRGSKFDCKSLLKFADGVQAHYEALWEGRNAPRENIHGLIMARPGEGKSTLASTFPKPTLVFMFDPMGKEIPYLDRGVAGPITKERFCYSRQVFSAKKGEEK